MNFDKPVDKHIDDLRQMLEIIGDKWSVVLLVSLTKGPRRFTDFEQCCTGISTRTLAKRLRMLEEKGLITKHVTNDFPRRIEYTICQKGEELTPVFTAMKAWAAKYL